MPRPLRPIDDGLVYHVINRGNNRQPVFHDEGDYVAFLNAVADLKERKPFDLYGYCLMGNHVRDAGRRMSIKRPTLTSWRPSVAAVRRGCLTAQVRGLTGYRGV